MYELIHDIPSTVERRETLNSGLLSELEKRGVFFTIYNEFEEPFYQAFMDLGEDYEYGFGEIKFGMGAMWFDEDNLTPIVAMAHELGHYDDLTEKFSGDSQLYQSLGIKVIELRAWLHAVTILHSIGFVEWDGFLIYSRSCLSSYFDPSYFFDPWEDLAYSSDSHYEHTLEECLAILRDFVQTVTKGAGGRCELGEVI